MEQYQFANWCWSLGKPDLAQPGKPHAVILLVLVSNQQKPCNAGRKPPEASEAVQLSLVRIGCSVVVRLTMPQLRLLVSRFSFGEFASFCQNTSCHVSSIFVIFDEIKLSFLIMLDNTRYDNYTLNIPDMVINKKETKFMRKTVCILGIGQRKAGVGKNTGRPYDFTEVSISYADAQTTGQKAETIAIDQGILDCCLLTPGDVVDVEMWQQNFKTRIGAIYG